MNNEIKVATCYSGLFINMDIVEMQNFLENIAINIITQIKTTVGSYSAIPYATTLVNEYCSGISNTLIDEYCSGISECVLNSMLLTNVKILYSFIENCVLSNNVSSLYLFKQKNKNGQPSYKLFTLALKEYSKYSSNDVFSEYNEAFEKLMHNTFGI